MNYGIPRVHDDARGEFFVGRSRQAPAGVLEETESLMEEFSLHPTPYRLLKEAGRI